MSEIVNNIFSVNEQTFHQQALAVFQYQYAENLVYRQWVDALSIDPGAIKTIDTIPFLPISFFKSHTVTTGRFRAQKVFASSGTTQSVSSKHFIRTLNVYIKSFTTGFQQFYGEPGDWCIIGLLPSYLERQDSSLVLMVDQLIRQSAHPQSGFYLDELDQLAEVLQQLQASKQKTLLIGVTFALLDFAAAHPMQLNNTVIMETGGMKGRRREMVRDEVHEILQRQFGVQSVHAEYGMTELLSQAYSTKDGVFTSVPWMKVLVRDEDDPFAISTIGRGGINVIDLANIYSCSFIATDDLGYVLSDGSFKVLGRLDASDVRGCSLMVM